MSQNSTGQPANSAELQRLETLEDLGVGTAGFCHAGKITLHIGHEHRHAEIGEPLGERLHRDGLARAGGAGDQTVAIGKAGQERQRDFFILGQSMRKIISTMAGHSRWANVKHQQRADAKRGKIFTRLIREITVAARLGGAIRGNPRLRLALEKAREQNLPGDNIQRNPARLGRARRHGIRGSALRRLRSGGAAVMLDCLTDNRTRTVAEVRHAFTKTAATSAPTARSPTSSSIAGSLCSRPARARTR